MMGQRLSRHGSRVGLQRKNSSLRNTPMPANSSSEGTCLAAVTAPSLAQSESGTESINITNHILQLETPCFYSLTSCFFLQELPTLMAVCKRFRDLIDTDECVARCEGLLVDGLLWFDRTETPPTRALLSLGSRLEKQPPHLYTIAISYTREKEPPLLLQQFLSLNASICRALWIYDSAGGFGNLLEDLVSEMHELREVGVIGEDVDSLFIRRFLRQLFLSPQTHLKSLWLGVGDNSLGCLRSAVAKTSTMNTNVQSVFATLANIHVNLGGYSCGLLALTSTLELLQKRLQPGCRVHLDGTLKISSFPSLTAPVDRAERPLGSATIEEAYDRVFRYNSDGPAIDGGTNFCSTLDQDVLLNSFRLSEQQQQLLEQQQREVAAPAPAQQSFRFQRFRTHSLTLHEGLSVRGVSGTDGKGYSVMSKGLTAFKVERLIELRCSLRRCQGEFEAAGEWRLHKLLAATFSSLPNDALCAYRKRFGTNARSLPSLVVELPRRRGFPVPLHLLSKFKLLVRAFVTEFSSFLVEVPGGFAFENRNGTGSGRTSDNDGGVKEILECIRTEDQMKIAGIQLDLQQPWFSCEAMSRTAAELTRVDENKGEADPVRGELRSSDNLTFLADELLASMRGLGLRVDGWWMLRLKATRRTKLTRNFIDFLLTLLRFQGEPAILEWNIVRDCSKQEHFTTSVAYPLRMMDKLLKERNYICHERLFEWRDTITYVKETC